MDKTLEKNIKIFNTIDGLKIYQIPLREFPGLLGFAYLVQIGEYCVLIDTGSGFGDSNSDLEQGFEFISEYSNRKIRLKDITHIMLTHAHVDHFGGLNYVLSKSDALVGVHELDRMIVTNFEERLLIVAKYLEEYLIEAGVRAELIDELIRMYSSAKSLYTSVKLDFTYESIGMKLGPFKIFHVPGHSAGHVVIQFKDILFSGDHVLDETSPHQAPEKITLSTGLEHYLNSLETLRPMAGKLRVVLGGHEHPIYDLEKRLDSIREHHMERLQKVLDLLKEPATIAQVSENLFGQALGYHQLLALEETGAHIEYLYNRGLLKISNLSDIARISGYSSSPIFYQCVECEFIDPKIKLAHV